MAYILACILDIQVYPQKGYEFKLSTGTYFDLNNISPCIHKASSGSEVLEFSHEDREILKRDFYK